MSAVPPGSSIETEVFRIQALVEEGQFAAALAAAHRLLKEVPENRDVLYLVAVNQRLVGQANDALSTLARLQALHPGFGRLFQERGHCYRTLNDVAGAIAAYQAAVELNGALLASWQALAELSCAAGQGATASFAAEQVHRLTQLPHPVLNAKGLLADGDVYSADRVVRKYLQTNPRHTEAMHLLAQIAMRLNVLDDAEFLLESVLTFAPDYHLARYNYATVLSQRHKHARALTEARTLLESNPTDRAFHTLYANACVGLGEHEEALREFYALLSETPDNAELHLSIGHAYKTLGRRSEAIESYRAAAAVRPSFGDSYWSLANLKTYQFSDVELAQMRIQETAPTLGEVDRYHLCFALGKALEDRGEFAESFRYYERGNALKRAETSYSADALERTLQRQAALFTAQFFSARRNSGCDRPDAIFIVGLPRAGSTLIEQILASHSQIDGTMELSDIPRLAQQLQGREHSDRNPRYPMVLAGLNNAQLRRFGEKYLEDTRDYRRGKLRFIDKMPNNFRHIGLIHLILPNAKIIDARREPMACCFSNYKQLFANGQEFTYSLHDVGRYYCAYTEIMEHWDRVLPGKILRVQYEELVENLEEQTRRILSFLGLEFERPCLDFHKTDRSIRTASSEQVRRPIYREGIDHWRRFEQWLRPLKDSLGALAATGQHRANTTTERNSSHIGKIK